MNNPAIGLGLALAIALATALGACTMAAPGMPDQGHHHGQQGASSATAEAPHVPGAMVETRQFVPYPDALRIHTLANMRDHLLTLARIQEALAAGSFDRASELAEQRLGMSSLEMHGAHEASQFMPQGMQDAGTAMHRSASRFAIAAKDGSATGELKPVLAALAGLNQTCVACHAAYRIQ